MEEKRLEPEVESKVEEIETTEVETEGKKKKMCKLEFLPLEIKKELNALIQQGLGQVNLKKVLEERFPNKSQFLPASHPTYQVYIDAHKDELMHQLTVQKSLVESTKESYVDMKTAIEAVVSDDTLENKKKALEVLYKRIDERIELLKDTQASGFLSAQLETVIGAYIREQRNIIEKLITLKADLEKDNSAQLYAEFENLTYSWFVTVLNAFKKVHNEDKLIEFQSILKEELPKITQEYIKTNTK
jgi:hypothetical protein